MELPSIPPPTAPAMLASIGRLPFAGGCGYTGWIDTTLSILSSGSYKREFGVTNWDDTAWDSGMAFNNVTIGGGHGRFGSGAKIEDDYFIDDDRHDHIAAAPVPEPETYAMMLAGLGMLGFVARRRRRKCAA